MPDHSQQSSSTPCQACPAGLFKLIFDNPLLEIGNHSQTQAHQFYLSYYDSGLRILRIEAAIGAPSACATPSAPIQSYRGTTVNA